MLRGIDISTHNKVIDFDKVKASGLVDFVIIRAGFGVNNIDAYFIRNIKECIRVGLKIGVYWFTYALNAEGARKEALACIKAIEPYREHIVWGVWFDLEDDSVKYAQGKGVNIDPSAHAKAFLEEITKAGYMAGNYTNADYTRRKVFNAEIMAYPTWLAVYGTNSGKEPNYNVQHITPHVIWQYTSRGVIPGIPGMVDVNLGYVDYSNKATTLPTPKDDWVFDKESNQWWYRYADGTYPKAQWLELNGKWYYFDNAGWMVEGWLEYKGDWYYLQPRDGYMVSDVLLKLSDGMYYIKSDGKLALTDASGRLV